jgi:hypothetical protein
VVGRWERSSGGVGMAREKADGKWWRTSEVGDEILDGEDVMIENEKIYGYL